MGFGASTSAIGALITAAHAVSDAVADAIKLKTDNLPADPADQSDLASTKESGPAIIGSHDVKGEVDGDATYNFRSEETNRGDAISALADNLELYDVQVGLRVYYE